MELLERVGLADKAGELSRPALRRPAAAGGDRPGAGQRPRLLLLDEVTSALDPELVGEVLGLVRELEGEGMTMVMATHEMGFARQVADRVCFLDAGRRARDGPAGAGARRPGASRAPGSSWPGSSRPAGSSGPDTAWTTVLRGELAAVDR